jgi:hypothetical protein
LKIQYFYFFLILFYFFVEHEDEQLATKEEEDYDECGNVIEWRQELIYHTRRPHQRWTSGERTELFRSRTGDLSPRACTNCSEVGRVSSLACAAMACGRAQTTADG